MTVLAFWYSQYFEADIQTVRILMQRSFFEADR